MTFRSVLLVHIICVAGMMVICFVPSLAIASTIVSRNIATNTTWILSKSPYVVAKDIVIDPHATLIIDPGVVIAFDKSSLIVEGIITSKGSTSHPICFTSLEDLQCQGSMRISSDKQWGGIILHSSMKADFSNIFMLYAKSAVYLSHAKATINVARISQGSEGITSDNQSSLSAYDIHIDHMRGSGLSAFNGSSIALSSSTIEDTAGDAMNIYNHSSLSLNGMDIKDSINCITVYKQSTAHINGLTCGGRHQNGIQLFNDSNAIIQNTRINDSESTAIALYGSTMKAEHDVFEDNHYAIQAFDDIDHGNNSHLTVENSRFSHTSSYAILAYTNNHPFAVNNWWGDDSGPYNQTSNPLGQGDRLSDNVQFRPYIHGEAPHATCCSSIAFIPGIELSKLYTDKNGTERKLWEPSLMANTRDLFMDASGQSLDARIYTRDIVTQGFGYDVYGSFMSYLNALVSSHRIKDWKPLPYDWRQGAESTVAKGVLLEHGKVYNMITQLEYLAASSITGKVSIIAHSFGGIIAKEILQELSKRGEIGLVDKVIMVAVPELGVPEALIALLHGDDQSILHGLVLKQKDAMQLAVNMLSAYELLPSEKYFSQSAVSPLITFDKSVDIVSNVRQQFGDSITNFDAFNRFLISKNLTTGNSGHGDRPSILNKTLLSESKDFHGRIDQENQFEDHIVRIVGWGVPTLGSISYSAHMTCLFTLCSSYSLRHEAHKSIAGDGTVPLGSILKAGLTFYANLLKFNAKNHGKAQHDTIMNMTAIQSLITAIITSVNADIPYISKTVPVA